MTEQKETSIVKYDTPRGEVALSYRAVQALCPKATPDEIALFIKVCLYHRLNPFLREVYLVKYDANAPASIIVGKDTFTQRAEADPNFDGFTAGLIVKRGEETIRLPGAFLPDGDTLVGGWAEVYRKDKAHPFGTTVSVKEYNRGQSSWRTMPATMIRKVALVQALREAFPRLFAGLYDNAETGDMDAVEGEVIHTGAAPSNGQAEARVGNSLSGSPAGHIEPAPTPDEPLPQFINAGEFMNWVHQLWPKATATEVCKALSVKSVQEIKDFGANAHWLLAAWPREKP